MANPDGRLSRSLGRPGDDGVSLQLLGQQPGLTSHSGPEVPLGQWQRKPSSRSSQRPPWQGSLAQAFSRTSQCRPAKPRGHTHW